MDRLLTRRTLGLAAAGASALGAVGGLAGARAQEMSGPGGGDWFEMIRRHHQEIARRLEAFQAAQDHEAQMAAFQAFSAINAAHSIAEEISVYPALQMNGAQDPSWHLYHEQDEAKVLSARINTALAMHRGDEAQSLAAQLKTALLHHVAEEENQIFPRLRSMADGQINALLTRTYAMEFHRAMG